MRRVAVVVCALAALFTIPAAAASSDVTMKNTMFNPSSVMVNAGDTVTWHNQDGYAHTVTANDHSFDSGNVAGTVGTYSHTFSQPGTYPYHCEIHGGMTGTVTVQGGPAPTQPPAPAPSPQPAPAPAATTAPRTPAAPPTTALSTTTTSSTTTTIAPPAAADAGTTSSTTAAAGGGVAFPAKKTSTGGDSVSPWLVVLAVVLVLGAGTGGVLLRRRLV